MPDSPPDAAAEDATASDVEAILSYKKTPTTPALAHKKLVRKVAAAGLAQPPSSLPAAPGDSETPPLPPVTDAPAAPVVPEDFAAALEDSQHKPKEKMVLKARTLSGVNYAAAFLLYAKGHPLKAIADEFGMNYGKLVERADGEEWDLLVTKRAAVIVAPQARPENPGTALAELDKKDAKIQRNRDNAFDAADRLRQNAVKVLEAYESENQFLRPEDMLTLAKALKITTEISMLALGDVQARGAEMASGNSRSNSGPVFNINLPAAVAGKVLRPAERAVAEMPLPESPLNDPEVIEASIIGARQAEAEAVPAKHGGHTINFDALKSPKPKPSKASSAAEDSGADSGDPVATGNPAA